MPAGLALLDCASLAPTASLLQNSATVDEVCITDPRDLSRACGWIHDQWFDIEGIAFDTPHSLLTLPFHWADREKCRPVWNLWLVSKFAVPTYQSFLRIHHVDDYRLRDTEGIRFYSFNELRYDAPSRRLSVLVNERLEFWASVRDCEIAIQETDSVLDPDKPIWYFLLAEFENAPRRRS